MEQVPQVCGGEIASAFAGYLSDESRLIGSAERLFFPENTAHVAAVAAWAQKNGVALTVSGARTGITGGAVPRGGAVLSCERLRSLGPVVQSGGGYVLPAGAGVTIKDIGEALASRSVDGLPDVPLFYAPDPTETTAQVGGTIACNASGARTYRYGATRRHIRALTVVLADGSVLNLSRGEAAFDRDGRMAFELPRGTIDVALPRVRRPAVRKDVAGFYSEPGMDAVDLFIGSEGVIGIVTEAELVLTAEPAERISALIFAPEEAAAMNIVRALRNAAVAVEAMEYFDARSLALLHNKRSEDGAGSEIPPFPYPAGSAVFTEFACEGESGVDEALDFLMSLVEGAGVPEDFTWVGTEAAESLRMKAFRHALPETVNSVIGRRKAGVPGIHKVGTDLAVPDGALDDFMAAHRRILEPFEYVVFGHIGDNHLHANILPRTEEELAGAKEAYRELVCETLRLGGTVAAEHGIGKLKTRYLAMMLPPDALAAMKAIKLALDPAGILCPGNVFK